MGTVKITYSHMCGSIERVDQTVYHAVADLGALAPAPPKHPPPTSGTISYY